MTDKEFEEVIKYLDEKAGRFSKGLEMSVVALSKIIKEMSLFDAKKKINYVFYTEYRKQRSDEYYRPLSMYTKNSDGELKEFDPSEANRPHTAYGKDISSVCIGCGGKYIKTGKWQKYCTPKCKKRYYRKINK